MIKFHVLILFIGLLSCEESGKQSEFETEKIDELFFVDNFIPDYLKTDKYISISREGSIEWSAMESILIVDKDFVHSDTTGWFDVHYINVNHFQNKLTRQSEPSVTIHRVKLRGLKNNISLNKYSRICRRCVEDVYELGYGEGHCANFYTIRSMDSDSIIYVSRSSDDKIKFMVKELFSKISPQEDFQSLSLWKDCKSMDSIAYKLMFNKDIDETKYILPYTPPVKHN